MWRRVGHRGGGERGEHARTKWQEGRNYQEVILDKVVAFELAVCARH